VDCVNYVPTTSLCRALQVEISRPDTTAPTSLSQSYRCPDYTQSPEAAQQAAARKGKERVKAETAPAAAPRPAAVPAAKPAARPPAMDPAKPKRPQVIAHRGCCLEAPENTLASIGRAAALRCDAIEFDVHVTSDGHPVVIHDATVDRTTNGTGPVVGMTLAEIRTLDAGSWFADSFSDERVPTLEEALEAAGGALVALHVRCHENDSDRAEKAIVGALQNAGMVERAWAIHHTRHGLYRLRKLEDNLRLCWLPRDGGKDLEYIDDAFYMGYRIIQPTYRVVTPEFVAYARRKQLWINVFWADEEELMRQLTALGVNGILTNKPELLQTVVGAGRRQE
jgi:glycerophosphoryl diester phosphodiesterase